MALLHLGLYALVLMQSHGEVGPAPVTNAAYHHKQHKEAVSGSLPHGRIQESGESSRQVLLANERGMVLPRGLRAWVHVVSTARQRARTGGGTGWGGGSAQNTYWRLSVPKVR